MTFEHQEIMDEYIVAMVYEGWYRESKEPDQQNVLYLMDGSLIDDHYLPYQFLTKEEVAFLFEQKGVIIRRREKNWNVEYFDEAKALGQAWAKIAGEPREPEPIEEEE